MTPKEIQILELARSLIVNHYEERERTCRQFKWICSAHLPQAGEGYTKNKNVFDIQDKTIKDIQQEKQEAVKFIMNLINNN